MSERPSDEQIVEVLEQLIDEKGYVVIGTKNGFTPYQRGESIRVLFGIQTENIYKVDCFTDGAEYDEQLKRVAELRPLWPETVKAERWYGPGTKFYRIVRSVAN